MGNRSIVALPPELMQLTRSCVWTDDAAAFCKALRAIPPHSWPAFEAALRDALEWHARHPPLRQVKLARLLIFGALNWSAQWYDRRKGASLDDLTDAALRLFIH